MMSAVSIQQNQSASRKLLYFNAAVLLLIMLSAFATIYSTHACRALYTQLQVLESSAIVIALLPGSGRAVCLARTSGVANIVATNT